MNLSCEIEIMEKFNVFNHMSSNNHGTLTYSSEYIAFANKQTRFYFCLDNLIIAI